MGPGKLIGCLFLPPAPLQALISGCLSLLCHIRRLRSKWTGKISQIGKEVMDNKGVRKDQPNMVSIGS